MTYYENEAKLNGLKQKYGTIERVYYALEIALKNAQKVNNKQAINIINELITHIDLYHGIFSI